MERSQELDHFLQDRLSAAGTVVFQNDPHSSHADVKGRTMEDNLEKSSPMPRVEASPISAVEEPTSPVSPSPPKSGGLFAFWQKQVTNTTLRPTPVQTGGISGLSVSAAAAYATAQGKHQSIALPLTASTMLPYHGKGVDYRNKTSQPSRSFSGSRSFGKQGSLKWDDDGVGLNEDGAVNENGEDVGQSGEGVLGDQESSGENIVVPNPSDGEYPLPVLNLSPSVSHRPPEGLTASTAVLALLRTTDFCLSVSTPRKNEGREDEEGEEQGPVEEKGVDVTAMEQFSPGTLALQSCPVPEYSFPRRAMVKLLTQFAAVRSKGLVDLAAVVESFRLCEYHFKQQRRQRMGLRFKQQRHALLSRKATATIRGEKGAAKLEDASQLLPDFNVNKALLKEGAQIEISSAEADALMYALRQECNALREKFNICRENDEDQPLLMLCDGGVEEEQLARFSKSLEDALPELTLETDDALAPMSVPKALRMAPICQATGADAIKAIDESLEVVNIVPLPPALQGGVGCVEEDSPEEESETGCSAQDNKAPAFDETQPITNDAADNMGLLEIAMFNADINDHPEADGFQGGDSLSNQEPVHDDNERNQETTDEEDSGPKPEDKHSQRETIITDPDKKTDSTTAPDSCVAVSGDIAGAQTVHEKGRELRSPSTGSTHDETDEGKFLREENGDAGGGGSNDCISTDVQGMIALSEERVIQPVNPRPLRRKRSWFSPSCLRPATLE